MLRIYCDMIRRFLFTLTLALATVAYADTPLIPERIIFNWHNFLSGCSTWNLEDWKKWTDEARDLGFNAIMVHAYGNNPMVSFSYHGKRKPTGYLSTTVRGRDWATMHVNDVRNLVGGKVFDSAIFGSDAGQCAEDERESAACKLMQAVFAHAIASGMKVDVAVDVDTESANPQDLIMSLPAEARFAVPPRDKNGVEKPGNKFWLANPDTPEGFDYYRAQVASITKAYPQISTLVLWFRAGGTPWIDLKTVDLPQKWQAEYNESVAKNPAAGKFWRAQNLFALGKILWAYQRALDELGCSQIRLAVGSWQFRFLPAANYFFPEKVPLIGLDYAVISGRSVLSTPEGRRELAEVGAQRPVIPIIWAQHDDGAYLVRPFTPFQDFSGKLREAKASGFGIIHWTTRPLEVFITSHIRQVFAETKDEPLRETCRHVGGNDLAEYLYRWVTEAPQFARETGDFFIDRKLTDVQQVIAGCRSRQALLKNVTGTSAAYYRGLEDFTAAFYEAQDQLQTAEELRHKGDIEGAREVLSQSRPEEVIEKYADVSSLCGITRGEQGILVSLNTRWLVYFVRLRQALGLDPIRYKFGPTSHDVLAQAPGRNTFFFDKDRHVWQTLGPDVVGGQAFLDKDAQDEIFGSGVESDKLIAWNVGPILKNANNPAVLPAGDYRLQVKLANPNATAKGQSVTKMRVLILDQATGSPKEIAEREVDAYSESGGPHHGYEIAVPVHLDNPGGVKITLTPTKGNVAICGITLKVVEPSKGSVPRIDALQAKKMQSPL